MSLQGQAWLDGEGDEWYSRNRSIIDNPTYIPPDVKFIIKTLSKSTFQIRNILEIGCSSASKLNLLSSGFEASGTGIDPSNSASREGKNRFPKLDLHVGLASSLPLPSQKFDLVFFGFCLYLIPPEELEKTISESLRVSRPNSFIAITDFDPGFESIVPYKFEPGLNSFKRSYTEVIKHYHDVALVSKLSFNHADEFFTVDRSERISTQIFFLE